jgi:hypothetical protein
MLRDGRIRRDNRRASPPGVVPVAWCDGCDGHGRGPDGFLIIVDRYPGVDEVAVHDLAKGAEHGEVEYALTKPQWQARTAVG